MKDLAAMEPHCCLGIFLVVLLVADLGVAAESGYFWHVTDFHLDSNFTTNGANARNDSDFFTGGSYDTETCWVEGGGRFGDHNCDSPAELIASAVAFVTQYTQDNFDVSDRPFVIWTGDDTSHADNSNWSLDSVLSVVEYLTAALDTTGLDVYPAMGNHDSHPKSQFPDDADDELYVRTGEIWRQWLEDRDSAYDQFLANGAFYSVSKSTTGLPFHLVCLNTNLYYRSNNELDGSEEDPLGQFQWLEELLQQYKNSAERAVLFAHITPGKFERYYQDEGWDWFRPEFNERFVGILEAYPETIAGQFYGHQHTDAIKTFGLTWAALAPSVTPWRSTLAPETGANNPGVRLVEYDKDSGEILDYTQFYLNLAAANAAGAAVWEELYSLKEYYGLEDASVASVNDLAERIGEDQDMFAKYYWANTVAFEEYSASVCDSACAAYHFCSMTQQRYSDFESCLDARIQRESSSDSNNGGALSLCLLLVSSLWLAALA